MQSPAGITRVIVVVLDGLRADAIPLFQLPVLQGLMAVGSSTLSARTVSPSITTAAITSLLTGVTPRVHGIATDRIGIPRGASSLTSLASCLAESGIPTRGFRALLPWGFRRVGRQIVGRLGARVTFAGQHASQVLDATLPSLVAEPGGLWICHWPDADLAGHAAGWTSSRYRRAVEDYDRVLGRLVDATGLLDDPATVLIALADHGGGGRAARHHASDHPLDTAIPVIIAGGQVARGELARGTSLLDVPATVPWLFGVPTPASYQGRILVESMAITAGAALALEAA